MQAAMMMLDATPRPLCDKSIASTGLVPLSSSIGSGWPLTLRNQEAEVKGLPDEQLAIHGFEHSCRGWAAHLRVLSLLSGSASANLSTPDMSLPLFVRLLASKLCGKSRRGADEVKVFSGP